MSRIRTVKPDFWKHEDLSALPPETHILAAALLNYADDEGYFNANPKLVEAECCPLRDDSVSVHGSLNRLCEIGFIRIGTGNDGKRYGHVIKFLDHQRVNRPKDSKIKGLEIKWDNSVIDHGGISDSSSPEGNGRERKGKEKPFGASADTPKEKSSKKQYTPEFEELWKTRPKRQGPDSKWDAFKAYRARLRDGHTHEQMAEGMKKYEAWLKSQGKANTEFVKATATFLGPAEHFLEDWSSVPDRPPQSNGGKMTDEEYYLRGAY